MINELVRAYPPQRKTPCLVIHLVNSFAYPVECAFVTVASNFGNESSGEDEYLSKLFYWMFQ